MARQTYAEYKKERDEATKVKFPLKQNLKTEYFKTQSDLIKLASLPGKPVKSNVKVIQSAPQTILSKEQAMLNALFNQKNQMWGGNDPVRINRTLTSGNGLIKTGSGDDTRRLLF